MLVSGSMGSSWLSPAYAATANNLAVRAYSIDGEALSMYATIKSDGITIKTGFTPLTYSGTTGKTYTVEVSNYKDLTFSKWGNGSTDNPRTVTLSTDTTAVAYFKTTSALSVRAYSIDGEALSMYATIKSGSNTVKSGFTPFTYTGIKGETYTVTVSNYKDLTFSKWGNGSTDNPRTVTLSTDTTAVAYFGAKHRIYVPAFWGTWSTSLIAEWDRLIQSVRDNKELTFVVAINPASGPGTSQNALLASKAQALKDAGATVIGYVGVNYFSELPKSQYPVNNPWPSNTPKTMADLKKEVDRYISFYPMVEGFMFDDYPSKKWISGLPDGSSKEVYSLARQLNDYARSKPGITYIQSNPGIPPHPDYYLLNDNMITFEGTYVPSLSLLDTITENGKYSSKTTVVIHSLSTLPDKLTISNLFVKAKAIYITHNTYNTLPSYWDQLIARSK
jgi:hypothetical protein